jgi:hypothetical protein
MMRSIQDYAEKINSRLTWLDLISLFLTTVILLGFTVFLYLKQNNTTLPITYTVSTAGEVAGLAADTRPFASINGKTYTFAWCGGSGNIAAKNKIYFADEAQAIASGRTFSKLCQK